MSAPTLIAGDVATVELLALRLGGVADETLSAASRLDRLHAGTWLGAAADKFGVKAGELPPKLHMAAEAFRSAEGAYRSYAADLSHGQSEALRAVSLWSSGVSASALWRSRIEGLPAHDPGRSAADPGASLRDQASVVYRDAVDLVDVSARRAAEMLHHAASLAPHGPGFWSQAWHATTSFADGVWDGTVGMVKMAWEFSPLRLEIDPQGWARDTEALGRGLYWGATHPVDLGKAIADNFMKNPAHGLGELVPGLLLAAVTGGGSLAANAIREGTAQMVDIAAVLARKVAIRAQTMVVDQTGSASIEFLSLGLARRLVAVPRVVQVGDSYAASAVQARLMTRQFASESQLVGPGTAMAGPGTNKAVKVADRLAREYGGQPTDWAKMSSPPSRERGGFAHEVHWYEHVVTGQRVEPKTKIMTRLNK